MWNWLFKTKSKAWDASGKGPRLQNWVVGNTSINSLLFNHLETLRDRSRDMVRKNPYASNIVETLVSNCIGTGIKPQIKLANGKLKKQLQQLWLDWTDVADSAAVTDFYGLQALIVRSMVESGECLVRFRIRKPEDQMTVPLEVHPKSWTIKLQN